jgi:hypothetical protein
MLNDYYEKLVRNAYRGVIRNILRDTQNSGLKKDQYFFISFTPSFPGVGVSDALKSAYPDEITIVLQHEFWDLKANESSFEVTLCFDGVNQHIVVPYTAITDFCDPSVDFSLELDPEDGIEEELDAFVTSIVNKSKEKKSPTPNHDDGATIISFDSLRTKKP